MLYLFGSIGTIYKDKCAIVSCEVCYSLVWRHLIHPISSSVLLAICLMKNFAIIKFLSYNSNDFVPIIDFSNHVCYIYLQIWNIIERFQQHVPSVTDVYISNIQNILTRCIFDIVFFCVVAPTPCSFDASFFPCFTNFCRHREWIYITILNIKWPIIQKMLFNTDKFHRIKIHLF